jgi:hypothetical protein
LYDGICSGSVAKRLLTDSDSMSVNCAAPMVIVLSPLPKLSTTASIPAPPSIVSVAFQRGASNEKMSLSEPPVRSSVSRPAVDHELAAVGLGRTVEGEGLADLQRRGVDHQPLARRGVALVHGDVVRVAAPEVSPQRVIEPLCSDTYSIPARLAGPNVSV